MLVAIISDIHANFEALQSVIEAADHLKAGRRQLINVGSVGQPRDGDPKASFCMIDTKLHTAEILRVEYNLAATADAIRSAGLPEFLAKRLYLGR